MVDVYHSREVVMKRFALSVLVSFAAVVLVSGPALARKALPNNDMAGSKMAVELVCEGQNVIFIGVAYNDLKKSDAMDGATVICWSPDRGEFMLPNNDMGDREKVIAKCDRETEYVYGVAYKDREKDDAADGVTVICRKKQGGDERIVEVKDLAGGRDYTRVTGENAIGIAYNDRKDSDETDGVTLVVKE